MYYLDNFLYVKTSSVQHCPLSLPIVVVVIVVAVVVIVVIVVVVSLRIQFSTS